MPHLFHLVELVLLTLLCICYVGGMGLMASLQYRGLTATRLPWPIFIWFFGLSGLGMFLSTYASYLRYFRGSPLQQSVADTCSVAGLLAYAIAFFVIRKPWKAFVAANGGMTWAVLEASQQRLWQVALHRSKP